MERWQLWVAEHALRILLCVVGVIAVLPWWRGTRDASPGLNRAASACLAVLCTMPLGLVAAIHSARSWDTYGVGLFIFLPFAMGALAAMLYGWQRPLSVLGSMLLGLYSVLALGAMMLIVAYEGLICLIMAAPLAIPLAMAGGAAGHAMLRLAKRPERVSFLLVFVALAPSGMVQLERGRTAPLFEVTTSIDIAASPEEVWRATIAPSRLERPASLAFRAGIAYPRGSWIVGQGAGATRYCDFSTGRLVEPVVAWEEPRLLRFRVVKNPEPMEEWSPYGHIHPAHLEGFLVSRQGQFRLIPIAGGTRLEATTWYEHGLYPAQYWRWWSDAIIHRIHGVVLERIRETALGGN